MHAHFKIWAPTFYPYINDKAYNEMTNNETRYRKAAITTVERIFIHIDGELRWAMNFELR